MKVLPLKREERGREEEGMEVEKVRGEEEATARKEHKRAANIEDAKRRFATGFVMLLR
jgi:hypothetical protein